MRQLVGKREPFGKRLAAAGVLFLFLIGCMGASSCAARGSGQAYTALLAMEAAEADCPAGDDYLLPDASSLRALPEDATVRTAGETLLGALFSSEEIPWELGTVDDGAIRLSTAKSPCEFIVLHCVSRSDTRDVSTLLLRRLELIRQGWNGTAEAERAAQGEVVIVGKYVILAVSSDTERAIDAARRAIR